MTDSSPTTPASAAAAAPAPTPTPTPSGRLVRTPAGRDLVLTRTFRAPIADVWASLTESERTARWYGSWTGEPGPGRTIQVTMGFEEGAPSMPMVIVDCEAPRHLGMRGTDTYASWHMDLRLAERDGTTTLTFVHHLDDKTDVGSVGPGWEYYLDLLVASREDRVGLPFEAYYPAQQGYFLGLAGE